MAFTLGDEDLTALATAVGVLRDSRPPIGGKAALIRAVAASGALSNGDNIVSLWDRMSARLSSDELFGPIIFDEEP